MTRCPIPNSTSRSSSLLAELRAAASRYQWQYLGVTDALRVLPSYPDRQDSPVVINARPVAVVLDKQAHRGAGSPVDFIEGPTKERLQANLASPTQVYHFMHSAGSWFAP